MDTMTLRIFQREVVKQCQFAFTAVRLLDSANAGFEDDKCPVDADTLTNQLWFSLQSFLISAANISKLLWGTKAGANAETWKTRQRERLQLRTSLGVADNSILKLSPEFRNHFEHLDERLEEWAESSVARILVNDMIGPTNAIGGIDSSNFLRSYDPEAQKLCFRGETFEIVPVARAIESLYVTAAAEARKLHWDDPPPQSATASGGGQ